MSRRQPIVKAHVEGIERAAKKLWGISYGASSMESWEQLREDLREHWRDRARATVAAYKGVPS